MDSSFFIADRLRGIPLVSQRKPTSTTASEDELSKATNSGPKALESIAQSKAVQVEKRDAANMSGAGEVASNQMLGATGQMTSGPKLLFKPAAMTAATSSITKKRPPTTSTTRRPKVSASRVSKVVSPQTSKPESRPATTSTSRPILAKMLMSAPHRQVDPSGLSRQAAANSSHLEPESKQDKRLTDGQVSARNNTSPELSRVSQQTMTTQPGFQRRAPQTVSTPQRYTNKLNDGSRAFAGENWVLFNRNDGQMSVFEVMVLMSSIMIFSTVILVILFNWIKSFQKRRNPQKGNQEESGAASGKPIAPTSEQAKASPYKSPTNISAQNDGASDRASRLSMNTSVSGNPTTTSVSEISQANNTTFNSKPAEQVKVGADAAERPISTALSDSAMAHKQISSELKGAQQIGVANKAMAIVQPTENNAPNASTFSDIDKPTSVTTSQLQEKTINRSASDLSGSRAAGLQKPTQQVKSVNEQPDLMITTSPMEDKRVAALEEIFNGSSTGPNANLKADLKGEANPGEQKKPASSKQEAKLDGGGLVERRLSVSSLESVELPDSLVNSIKRTASFNEKAEAPSPNLLLGESTREAQAAIENSGAVVVPSEAKSDTQMAPPSDRNEKRPAKGAAGPAQGRKLPAGKSDGVANERQATKQPMQDSAPAASKAKEAQSERPENPMGRDAAAAAAGQSKAPAKTAREEKSGEQRQSSKSKKGQDDPALKVKNHQVVVNKLDKRKTNLEIVDLRDESVTGKMRNGDKADADKLLLGDDKTTSGWISMDGVAVAQAAPGTVLGAQSATPNQQQQQVAGQQPTSISPSEIIESRFHVDYSGRRHRAGQKDSIDSKQEEYILNDIDNELEQDNKMRNRKYFVYVVHDGHFTAKKECIARIELPPKRRITLAEMRQLIANSQDISLSSLRRNRFKFVTETYRLLNENEDAAVLHQVYPTQGVFLKLNIPEQEGQAYAFKAGRTGTGARLSSGSGNTPSSLAQATIASRRRANTRPARQPEAATSAFLPAIEVGPASKSKSAASSYGRTRASSVSRRTRTSTQPPTRSKSSVQTGARNRRVAEGGASSNRLPIIGRLGAQSDGGAVRQMGSKLSSNAKITQNQSRAAFRAAGGAGRFGRQAVDPGQLDLQPANKSLGTAATDLGANVLSGAKRLFNATFNR